MRVEKGEVVRLRPQMAQHWPPRFREDLVVERWRELWGFRLGRAVLVSRYTLSRTTKSGKKELFPTMVNFDDIVPMRLRNKTLGDYL